MVVCRAAVPFEQDSSQLHVKKLNPSEINSYKKDRAFTYREEAPQDNGLASMFSYYISKFFRKLFSVHVGSVDLSSILLYGLMLFGILMLIFQFLKISPQGLLSRSSVSITTDREDGDNIHEINFEKLIRQAVAQQNYRLAVRFWYLNMLKVMSDAQLINWQINKTNYDYYYELKQQALRDEFLTLTNTFENAWYGNHNLSIDRYTEAQNAFSSFFTMLKKQ